MMIKQRIEGCNRWKNSAEETHYIFHITVEDTNENNEVDFPIDLRQ